MSRNGLQLFQSSFHIDAAARSLTQVLQQHANRPPLLRPASAAP
jgi:hypothetical protein